MTAVISGGSSRAVLLPGPRGARPGRAAEGRRRLKWMGRCRPGEDRVALSPGGSRPVLPRCAGTRLAVAHFWLHNLGLPVMMLSLSAAHLGEPRAEPLVGLGSILVMAGLALFTLNALRTASSPNDPA